MPGAPIAKLLLLAQALLFADVALAETALEARLRNRFEDGISNGGFEVLDERIHARETIRRVYVTRSYSPIWVSEDGISPRGRQFERWLANVPTLHGLRADDYHLEVIEELNDEDRLSAIVELELAMSDAFLMVGSHLLAGRLNPETLDAEWVANRRHRDLAPVLEAASVRDDPGAVLEDLLPTDAAYAMLVDELARLRRIRDAGGWPTLTAGPSLRISDAGPRIAELVDRLRLSGDFSGPTSAVFASSLEGAVKQFQGSHGLLADGIVGTATLQALNTPVEARIDQVIANLERWRWLPEELGEFYVVVNIASFRLDVVRDGQSVLDMRIVVGTPYRRTPVFSDQIRYLVLNPYWEVPNRIAIQDKLPLIKRNPNYLADQNFTVLQGWGTAERIIDPATVNWAGLSQQNFPYRLRQSPGPFNALGRVKFMFPNRFSVYLHDTPARELFDRETRTFSSGCIRLEAPLALAETLLSGDPKWSRAAINAASRAGREQTIQLPTPVPVHLQYWTAWIRRTDGKLQFSNDVYGRDQTVLRALREAAPK